MVRRLTISDIKDVCNGPTCKEGTKEKVLDLMLDILKSLPSTSEKADVMAETTREKLENPIYTKKLKFDIERFNDVSTGFSGMLNSLLDIEYISVSSDKEDFSNASTNDIRINCRDRYNNWVNVFADNYSYRYLEVLCILMMRLTEEPGIEVEDAPSDVKHEDLISEMNTLAREITEGHHNVSKIPEIIRLMKEALGKS